MNLFIDNPIYRFLQNFKLGRFIISGGIGAITNLVLLYLFTEIFGWWYILSATLSYALSFIVGFGLHKFWTFADPTTHVIRRQAVIYFSVAGLNLFINNLILFVLVDKFRLWYILAQAVTSIIIAFWSFFIYRSLFRHT